MGVLAVEKDYFKARIIQGKKICRGWKVENKSFHMVALIKAIQQCYSLK